MYGRDGDGRGFRRRVYYAAAGKKKPIGEIIRAALELGRSGEIPSRSPTVVNRSRRFTRTRGYTVAVVAVAAVFAGFRCRGRGALVVRAIVTVSVPGVAPV